MERGSGRRGEGEEEGEWAARREGGRGGVGGAARGEGEGEWAARREGGRGGGGSGGGGVGEERERMCGKDGAKNEIVKWRLEENQSKIRVRMPKTLSENRDRRVKNIKKNPRARFSGEI
ncbi:hypothetical protein TIFTF001_054455 [Ficus carica]|uniref:Uncharacterized protein n=1 Tax=Ficus carica TaxID=3494 RepID=A0AA88JF81_FICCA|nr:hypothetical protein TIFTF001_054455 [Ficus carica]